MIGVWAPCNEGWKCNPFVIAYRCEVTLATGYLSTLKISGRNRNPVVPTVVPLPDLLKSLDGDQKTNLIIFTKWLDVED